MHNICSLVVTSFFACLKFLGKPNPLQGIIQLVNWCKQWSILIFCIVCVRCTYSVILCTCSCNSSHIQQSHPPSMTLSISHVPPTYCINIHMGQGLVYRLQRRCGHVMGGSQAFYNGEYNYKQWSIFVLCLHTCSVLLLPHLATTPTTIHGTFIVFMYTNIPTFSPTPSHFHTKGPKEKRAYEFCILAFKVQMPIISSSKCSPYCRCYYHV